MHILHIAVKEQEEHIFISSVGMHTVEVDIKFIDTHQYIVLRTLVSFYQFDLQNTVTQFEEWYINSLGAIIYHVYLTFIDCKGVHVPIFGATRCKT